MDPLRNDPARRRELLDALLAQATARASGPDHCAPSGPPRHPFTGVAEVLNRLISVHGAPRFLPSDNGPEFVAAAIRCWLELRASRGGCTQPKVSPSAEGQLRDVQRCLNDHRT